ncbi:MAG: radical SAM protein [Lachnospiraceae bacterium]|nr:radical SAM protein [Lachnospiraceae bacterium]
MRYDGMVYRPPSEARSLIVQLTVGCAHNSCRFCTMYKDKKFYIRNVEEVIEDFRTAREYYGPGVRKIFLADGDALCVPTEKLMVVLKAAFSLFPDLERVTAYATAGDVLRKTPEELKALQEAGLFMVYQGYESGSNQVLLDVGKKFTKEQMIESGRKLKESGILSSVTLISGLGGTERLKEHAVESAALISAVKPEYVSFLTLYLEPEADMRKEVNEGRFHFLTPDQVVEEMELFLEHVDSEGTIFRSNHASNYVPLKGTLNKDIPLMRKQLEQIKEMQYYRSESSRAL